MAITDVHQVRTSTRSRLTIGGIALAVVAFFGATSGSAQPLQLQPLQLQITPPLQLLQATPATRTVTIQGGGLQFIDAFAVDQYNLGLNVVINSFNNGPSQRWVVTDTGGGLYTIMQQSTGQFLDAHEIAELDFRVVTRARQLFGNGDNGQFWRIVNFGGGFVTIQQVSSGRFLEPYLDAAHGFAVVTRPPGSQLQEWRMIDAP